MAVAGADTGRSLRPHGPETPAAEEGLRLDAITPRPRLARGPDGVRHGPDLVPASRAKVDLDLAALAAFTNGLAVGRRGR